MVGLLVDAEGQLTLGVRSRSCCLERLAHEILLGHPGQLAVVEALRRVRLLKPVYDRLVAINHALQDSRWARVLHICDVDVVSFSNIIRVQEHSVVWDQIVPV